MEIFCISASTKFRKEIKEIMQKAKTLGMTALFPNPDFDAKTNPITPETAKWLTFEHFEAIDQAEGLYVLCPGGYVGRSVTLEIGYAIAKGKPVFFSEKTNDTVLDILHTKVISVENIQQLKEV